MHIDQELVKQKIPIFSGRASKNNGQVLQTIALLDPSLKYDINKRIQGEYSTTSRRIDDLFRKGYLTKAGTRQTQRGVPETKYGLTWVGLIASLNLDDVRKNVLDVLNNHLNSLNTKNLQDAGVDLKQVFPLLDAFIESIFKSQPIEGYIKALFIGYLRSSTPPLERLVDLDESNKSAKWYWIMESIQASSSEVSKLPDGETVPLMDIIGLLDNHNILNSVQSLLPKISETFRQGLENQYRFLVHIPGEIGLLLQGLNPEDKPSLKVKDFLENELSRTSFSLEVKE